MSRQHDSRMARLLPARLFFRPRPRSPRNLQIEPLESRVVLSGSLEVAAAPEPPTALPPTEGESDAIATSPSASIATDVSLQAVEVESPESVPSAATFTETLSGAQAVDAVFTLTESSPTDSPLTASDATLATSHVLLDTSGMVTGPPPDAGGTADSAETLLVLPPLMTPPLMMPPPVTPRIVDLEGQNEAGYWLVHGSVTDDKDPTGLTVYFGGVLGGYTATVDYFGVFELIVFVGSGMFGYVDAYTIDGDGLRSATVTLRMV